jgi:hypothetical protein
MRVIFKVQEVHEQVINDLDPLPTNPIEAERSIFRDAKKKDNNTLFVIHQCVDSKVFEKIANCTTSKDSHIFLGRSGLGKNPEVWSEP